MATSDEFNEAMSEAQVALLKAVKYAADKQQPGYGIAARDYAEAYAWLRSPSQGHGSSTAAKG